TRSRHAPILLDRRPTSVRRDCHGPIPASTLRPSGTHPGGAMSVNGQRALVPRAALLHRTTLADPLLVEAPGGYGKTTLVNALAERADLPVVRLDLPQPTTVAGLVDHLARALRKSGHPMAGDAAVPEEPESSLAGVTGALAAGEPVVLVLDDAQWLEA